MALSILSAALLLASIVSGKTYGNSTDNHPKIETYRCTVKDGCHKKTNYLVLDAGKHGIKTSSGVSCTTGNNPPNSTACTTPEECATNCHISSIADYSSFGVHTQGTDIRLTMFNATGAEVSPRIYLLEKNKQRYEMLKLTGSEFTFDVDMVNLPCGMNSALYLSEMLPDGGKNASIYNKDGAAKGTGYCDAQCYKTSFINGVGNFDQKGACCSEMDIWEANSRTNQLAPHPCSQPGLYKCTGDECGQAGVCDKNGCAWNPYKVNATDYYGRGKDFKVDTTRKFSVVTQFPAQNGKVKEIRRLYIQDGKVIQNNVVNIEGPPKINYIDDEFCQATGASDFMRLGGVEGMGGALSRGMVLAMSLWWDKSGFMEWLDQGNSGPCNATEGNPSVITTIVANPEVTFSNIRFGELNSTLNLKGLGC
ncbi:glycosyl hydrolase family 7 [Colletotrichum orchidophilum]|uniref:Glucanase n=1 Tax=Colletotrichum orchidophilum TaxID=1209926 RepID=A0A1G4ASG7_9PEZI|nr:glycosyl hydrolase family 7 [Colletotrichum orchidophilum]OHE92108.1 glycosyl hydrolase family 7 [Colletotrichum orchidophilum]